ncbi:hypothetical protein GCM10010191_02040 [Actinomadura vinacea]|uniref:Nudix hydrolase domain-containing protein n=1 Tax=Actinomadura vinacea TaxID=115336 RepID=A0ABP5VDU6_9ACTN
MPSDTTRPHAMTAEQYYASRPVLFAGAGVLFRNDDGHILLVKPTYEPRWVIPGGAMEPAETPRQTARREINEELGLAHEPGMLLCVDFVPAKPPTRLKPGIMYLFDGGRLSAIEKNAITLPADELTDHRFVEPDALTDYIGGLLLRRVHAGLAVCQSGIPVDLEDGYPTQRSV